MIAPNLTGQGQSSWETATYKAIRIGKWMM
jgi:hypothetical protein